VSLELEPIPYHLPHLVSLLKWSGLPRLTRRGNRPIRTGEPDKNVPLPETADQVQCDDAQCDDLAAYIATVSPALAAAPIKARQACYLPRHMRFGDERAPLIGQTSTPGVWVAAGHTCWGIQNGPATGYLVAELLLDGAARSADIEALDPKKFKV
jgi:glycine/D-amino acid oxidase-like deaminating enzyme